MNMDYLDMTLINDMERQERRSVDYTFGLLREFSVSREEAAPGFSFSASASRKSSIDITTFVSKEDASRESPVNFVFEGFDSEVPSFELTPSVVSTLLPSVSCYQDTTRSSFSSGLPGVGASSVLPVAGCNTLPTLRTGTVPVDPVSQPIDTLLRERLEALRKAECRKRRQKRREILRLRRQKGLVSFDSPVRYQQRSEQANQRLRSSGRFVSELRYIDA